MNETELERLRNLGRAVELAIAVIETLPMRDVDPTRFPERQPDGQIYDIILQGRWGIVDLNRKD